MELSRGVFLQGTQYWEKFIGKNIIDHSNSTELYFEEPDIEAFVARLEKLYPDTE